MTIRMQKAELDHLASDLAAAYVVYEEAKKRSDEAFRFAKKLDDEFVEKLAAFIRANASSEKKA